MIPPVTAKPEDCLLLAVFACEVAVNDDDGSFRISYQQGELTVKGNRAV